jgi:hypothetical protein
MRHSLLNSIVSRDDQELVLGENRFRNDGAQAAEPNQPTTTAR